MKIDSAFDAGNIEVVAVDGDTARLKIRQDTHSEFYQWFNFRVSGAKGRELNLVIENADGAAYPKGWDDYRACYTYGRDLWHRLSTTRYEDGKLIMEITPEHDLVQLAYFAPFSHERHLDMVAGAATYAGVSYRSLGETVQGRAMDCLEFGDGHTHVWIIARQHPGESMASHWMEGFLAQVLGGGDYAEEAKQLIRFHVVPNMNPDGSVLGNLRTNAKGANLNREWNVATLERSPEVYHVRAAMESAPPALCLDVHGDEALPYNFIAGAEGIEGYTDDQARQLEEFLDNYKAATPEFQTEFGYAKTAPGKANLAMCTNYCAHAFGGLAMTLEMPFKDNADHPDEAFGWSPQRCRQLGADTLKPILEWARRRSA